MTDDLLYQLDGKMQLVKNDFYLLKKSRDCIDEQKKRIERLETALRKIACDGDPHFACFCDDPDECSYGIARRALEKKND